MQLSCKQPLVIAAISVLITGSARADVPKDVEETVHIVQTAFNKGDVATLKRYMTEDHTAVLTYAEFSNAADQLKVLPDWKFTDYKIANLTFRQLTADVGIVSFQATITGTYKGTPVPSPVHVVEVWLKRDGRWLEASYQETPVNWKGTGR